MKKGGHPTMEINGHLERQCRHCGSARHPLAHGMVPITNPQWFPPKYYAFPFLLVMKSVRRWSSIWAPNFGPSVWTVKGSTCLTGKHHLLEIHFHIFLWLIQSFYFVWLRGGHGISLMFRAFSFSLLHRACLDQGVTPALAKMHSLVLTGLPTTSLQMFQNHDQKGSS